MHKLDLEKTEEPEIKIANICWIIEKQENSSNTSTSASLTMLKPLTVCITTNCENFFSRDGNTRPPYLPGRNLYAGQEATVRTGHGTRDWIKIGKEYIKAVYSHLFI